MSYSLLNEGIFNYSFLSHERTIPAVLRDGITVNVGSQVTEPSTDVPEPSTLAIFALGVLGLTTRRFKKN